LATYYISTARGSDSNTSVQAQSPSTPWRTIGKALGTISASGNVAAGDVVSIEPGVYRELIKLSAAGSAGNVITVQGDVDGSAFRAGGYATPATGEVQITAYTTDDKTQPTNTVATIQANGKAYYSLSKLVVIGSRFGTACLDAGTSGSVGWTIRDCAFVAGISLAVLFKSTVDTALNLTVDRCYFASYLSNIEIDAVVSATAEYNLNVAVSNCLMLNGQNWAVYLINTNAAASNKMAYGVTVQGCTVLGDRGFSAYNFVSAITSTNAAMTVKNCNMWCYTLFNAGVSGMLVEDYNVYMSLKNFATGNNVSAGAHSIGQPSGGSQNYAPLFHFGQEAIWGGTPRPLGMPCAGSPYLNFGDGTAPAYDITGRNRPEGS
jgi:hypothetical protein